MVKTRVMARSGPARDADRRGQSTKLGTLFGLDAINAGHGGASRVAGDKRVAPILLPDGVVTALIGGAAAVAVCAVRPRPDRFACADGTVVNFVDASRLMVAGDD
jgi:hypothetical protein